MPHEISGHVTKFNGSTFTLNPNINSDSDIRNVTKTAKASLLTLSSKGNVLDQYLITGNILNVVL